MAAWWQQFTTQADKAEAAIAAQRQAASATGQPWPPRPEPGTAPDAGTRATSEVAHGATSVWSPEADREAAHVDPVWWARHKAAQTASVQAAKAARREAAARAIPVTDAEIALYGTRHHDPQPQADTAPELLLAAPTADTGPSGPPPVQAPAAEPHRQADTSAARHGGDLAAALDRLEIELADRRAEETLRQARSDYAARMTREAQHQAQAEPETHHDEPDLET